MNIGKTGKSGEDRVAAYLRSKGYAVVGRNYQCRYGEIDIIAEHGEYIIFVEVKTRKESSMVSPAESVDYAKRQRIRLTAEDYLSKTPCTLQPRFDIAQVTVYTRRDKSVGYKLLYTENAFF